MDYSVYEIVAFFTFLIISIGCSVYGAYKCLKEGRPLFYQLFVCAIILSALSNVYDTLTIFFFHQWWAGISLPTIAYYGEIMLFFGAVMEMVLFLKSKGIDCSLKTGFGLKTILLASVPAFLEVYGFFLLVPYNGVLYSAISLAFTLLPTYAAALVVLKKDDQSGFVRSLRLPCSGIMLACETGSFIDYTLCIDGPFYLINCCIFAFFAVIIVIGLERGNKKWI